MQFAPERDLLHALLAVAPQIVIYMMTFLTLGIFWVGQQTQLSHPSGLEGGLTWLHLAFLFAVTLMPFSTKLLARLAAYRRALLVYWADIVLLGATLCLTWVCAVRTALVKSDVSTEVIRTIRRRIALAQSVYALGALLCILSTRWSIVFIVLVQLDYAVAPRFGWRS